MPCANLEDALRLISDLQQRVDLKQQQYERSQRDWVEAAQKALAGDTGHLRLRIDLALSGPIEITEQDWEKRSDGRQTPRIPVQNPAH